MPNTVPFTAGDTWSLWPWPNPWFAPSRLETAMPKEVRVEPDNVTDMPRPDLPHGTVRLTIWADSLDDDLDRDLAERLVIVPGVRPESWVLGEDGGVAIPVVEPTSITDDQVIWQVTPNLAVHHADRVEGFLSLAASTTSPQHNFTDLTLPDCSRLVTALASLQYWRWELSAAFAAEATARRKALQRARAVRNLRRT